VGERQENPLPGREGTSRVPTEAARFGVPQTPSWFVRRPRLLRLLDAALEKPLLLVSGPAGSGKTALVADWVRSHGDDTTGWVTFDDNDDDVWSAVLRCLVKLGLRFPAGGLGVEDALDRRPLALLANAIARHGERLRLVLDGYEFASAETGRSLDFLIRHTDHQLQLVILTRVDPVLPLYRYRLEESIGELRASDLRLNDDEAGSLLERSGVTLAPESVHALNVRLRGWVAGLRFVARTLVVRDDPEPAAADVVAETGDIGEYLLGEVLEAQKPEVRQLLLRTSVPETLYPGLADELAERPMLSTIGTLTKINAFVEPVDGSLGCYRYYPFFRDLLRAQLAYESPQLMTELQLRTARWLEREELLEPSVLQLTSVGAWEEAVQLMVGHLGVGTLLAQGSTGPLAATLGRAPVDSAEGSVVRAALALLAGDPDRCDLELTRLDASDRRVADPATTRFAVALVKAVRARTAADPRETLRLAEEALALTDRFERRGDLPVRPESTALLRASQGVALLRLGDLSGASEVLTVAAEAASATELGGLQAECLGHLGLLDALEGRLTRAVRSATRAVAVADTVGLTEETRPAEASLTLAWVALQQYDLHAARAHLQAASMSARLDGVVPRGVLAEAQAGLLRAHGRSAEAVAVLERALAEVSTTDPWLADRLHTELARTRTSMGDPEAALLELDRLVLRDRPEPALAAAEARLARGDIDAVDGVLDTPRVREAGRHVQVSRLLLEARQQQVRLDAPAALAVLDRSLRLAAPDKLRRPFHEAAAPLQLVLRTDPGFTAEHGWLIRTLPSNPGSPRPRVPRQRTATALPPVDEQRRSPVVETLTPKELEVLAHLAELLSTEEIARAMFVSKNTVRTHIRSILRKLGVTRRNLAVRRARELDLLPG
jgi:LuxR family maltose regulon positive regulatory protein